MVAKKWLDGKLMAKKLIMTIQVNLVLNHSETLKRQHQINSPEFSLLIFLPLTYH